MITKIKLKNVRQYTDKEINTNSDVIVIHGDNTKGKSTVLEAIHLILNNSSPWSDFTDILHKDNQSDYFSISVDISEQNYTNSYFFYRSLTQKILKRDDKKISPKSFFVSHAVLFSPELIEILMISPSKRREFLDNYAGLLIPGYIENLSRYNKALRQRNALLKKLSKQFYETGEISLNNKQLDIWTTQLIEFNTEIIKGRSEFIKYINNDNLKIDYISDYLSNIAELSSISDELIQAHTKQTRRDIALGYTNTGAHRDDWDIFTDKSVKKYGSRGEKRLAIIECLFRINNLIKEKLGINPIILLDDVPSELDQNNTRNILLRALELNQQLFITTINKEYLPKELSKKALFINLNSENQT